MKHRALTTSCSLLSLLIASFNVNAEDDFSARIAVISRYSDNAAKTTEDPIAERQDRYELGLEGNYENAIIDIGANYLASENRFEKDSQPDRTLLEGDSHLRIGKQNQLFDLLLVHSRRALRSSPGQLDLLNNNDERQMLTATPSFHVGMTSADTLLLSGNFTEVDYRFREELNAEYKGGTFMWQRRLSAIHSLELSVQHTQVSFESFPIADYEYETAQLAYTASLRNLSYTLAGGYNQSERELGEKNSSPSFSAEVDYDTGVNRFTLYASQRITDTSLGDGNRGEIGLPNPGDVSSAGVDQIERRALELGWQTQALCERCEFGVNLNLREDEFLTLVQDNEERGGGVSGSYRFSKAASLNLSWNRREQRLSTLDEKFTLDRGVVEYQYTFVNRVSIAIFAENEKRKSDSGLTDYDELAGGLSLTYQY